MVTVTAQVFNQDVAAVQEAAADAPVIITNHGKPAFVLMSINDYHELSGDQETWVDRLSMDDDIDIDFQPLVIGLKVPEL